MTGFSRNTALDQYHGGEPHLPQPYAPASPAAVPHESPRRNPLQAIWMRRWIVVFCVILALIGGMVYYYRATPLYRSSARVYVEQIGPKITSNDPAMMAGTGNFLNTQAQFILAPVNLEQVATNPEVRDLPSFRNATDILSSLRYVLTAEVGRRDDIITVSALCANADDAAVIANAVVSAYDSYISGQRRQSAVEMAKYLQQNLNEREADLTN